MVVLEQIQEKNKKETMIDINAKIMEAMKAKDKVASETYKLLKAKILEYKTAKNAKPYDDAAEISIIRKMIKERKDSAEIYFTNNRPDLAQAEVEQTKVLDKLLPPTPTEDDIRAAIDNLYPDGIKKKDMGLAIKDVKAKLIGADGKMIADIVKSRLR